MKIVSYTKGIICTFLLLISGSVFADWVDISSDIEITKSRPAFDRINRVYFVHLDVKYTGESSLNSPFRLLIDNATIPVTNQSGDTELGIPFVDITNEKITENESIRVRVDFLAQRKALTFDVTVEAVSSPLSVYLSGVVGIEAIVGASVQLKSLSGDIIASTTTDHEGKYTFEVNESDISAGYELFSSKGGQGDFDDEVRAIYSSTDDRDKANLTLITSLIAKLSSINSPLSIEQRNIEVKKLIDLGLITSSDWFEMELSTVDMLSLHEWVNTRGVDNWLNDMVADLSDGELSRSMMKYFFKAHGGLAGISFTPAVSIALFPGQSRNILLTPVFIDGAKATTIKIISGPSWVSVVDEQLVITPEMDITNYNVFTVEVEIKENNSVIGRKQRFDVSLMEPVTLLTGELDPLGGKIESEWRDFTISVAERVLTQSYVIKYFAGIDGNGGIKFGLVSIPEMPESERHGLELSQPSIEVIKNNYLDEVLQGEQNKPIKSKSSFSINNQTKTSHQTISISKNNEQSYGELKHDYAQYYQSGVVGSGLPITKVCQPAVTGSKLNEMVWLNENTSNDDYIENGKILNTYTLPYVLQASSAMFDESTQFSVAESISGGYPRLQKNQSFRVKEAQERCASALRSTKSVEFDYSEYEAVLFVHGFINTGQLGGYEGDGLIFDSGSEYFHNFPSLVEKMTSASGQKYIPFVFQWRTNAKFEDVAAELGSAILMLNIKTGKKVHIVAHSFGGILTRVFAQGLSSSVFYDKNLAERSIASITTVGTPHSGTFGTQTNVELFNEQGQSKGILGFPEGRNGPAGALIDNCRAITCYQTGSGKHADGMYSSNGGVGNSELFGTGSIAGKAVYNLASGLNNYPQIATQSLIGLVPAQRILSTPEDVNYNISYDFLFDSAVANPGAGDRLISVFGQRLVPTTESSFLAPMYASPFIEEHILPMNTSAEQFYRGMDDEIVSTYISGGGVDDDWTIDAYATGISKNKLEHYAFGFNHRTGKYKQIDTSIGIKVNRLTEVGLYNCSDSNNCNHSTWNYFTSFIVDEGEDVTLPQEIKVKGSVVSDNVPFEDLVVRIYVPDSNEGEIIGSTAVDLNGNFEKYVSFRKNTAYWVTVSHKSSNKVRVLKTEEVLTSETLDESSLNFSDIPVVDNTDDVVTANLNIMAIDASTNNELLGYTVKIYNSEGFLEQLISQDAQITLSLPIGRYTLLANLANYNQVFKVCNVLISEVNDCKVEFESLSLDDGLVAYYPFDGNANDFSGNGHHGLENGGITYVEGVNRLSVSFDGVDDYFLVADSDSFPTNEISISFWVQMHELPSHIYNFVSKELAFQSYLINNGVFRSELWKGSPGKWKYYSSNQIDIPLDRWLHYAFTYSDKTKEAKTYIDGELVSNSIEQDPALILMSSNRNLYIGRNGLAATQFVKGELDELMLYNRALAPIEVTALYELNAKRNQPPTANAGNDLFVPVGEPASLDASNSSDDGVIEVYEWLENDIVVAIAQTFSTPNLVVGRHYFTLRVTDNFGAQDTDYVSVVVYDNQSDADNDGMPDAWELANGLDPLADDSLLDDDGDGRSNLQEYLGGTDPNTNDGYDPTPDLERGLVAYYPFDGDANDYSPNGGNDGIANGGVAYVDGVSRLSASFDGIDDYFLVANSDSFPTEAISLSYWIKVDELPNYLYNYVSKEHAFQSYFTNKNVFQSGFWKGVPGYWSGYESNEIDMLSAQWLHYTFTFSNNTKEAKTYINGTLVSNSIEQDPASILRSSNQDLYIGRNGSASTHFVKGNLDELRIYSRAISSDEVSELYLLDTSPEQSTNKVIDLNGNHKHWCAIANNKVTCWGEVYKYQEVEFLSTFVNPKQVSHGRNHACVLDDRGVECWGWDYYGVLDVPTLSSPSYLSSGEQHVCAIDDTGVVCWGKNNYGQIDVPDNLINPRQVSAGELNTCALDDTGVVCWGWDYIVNQQVNDILNPERVTLSQGAARICVSDSSNLSCWGSEPPTDFPDFTDITHIGQYDYAGYCAIDNNEVVCWDTLGVYKPSVSDPTVASYTDGTYCVGDDAGVRCWGRDDDGKLEVPPELNFNNVQNDQSGEVVFNEIKKTDWFASRARFRNSENWSAVNFTSNYVMLNQDQTDNGPSLLSIGIAPIDGKKLKISRKLELHSHISHSYLGGNEFFVGGLNIYSSSNSNKLSSDNSFLEGMCQVRYYDYEYQGDWDTFFLNDKDDINTHIPSIWDEQFVETLIYDPQTGEATYQIGSNIVTADCEPLNQDYIRIYMQSYGWWTGHYTKIYDFDVRWIDSSRPH
ncbi:MAG: hypothetical protein HRT53_14985 [Colwellia sp.]|nr:hypothetical protein [Colwellia sp.]